MFVVYTVLALSDVSFDDVVRYIHKGGATLIDVRNRNELQETGRIPTANNIPCV